jgi:hypothetical protein
MPVVPTSAFGFVADLAEINRWAARYRAAASYVGVELVGYQSSETVNGYSALVRSVLVWSAFERYLPLVGLDQKACGALLSGYDPETIVHSISAIDENGKLYSYIRSRVTSQTLGGELDKYFKGDRCNVSYLLSAIRHIFGHGHLTPGSNETSSVVTKQICDILCDFHLRVMDEEFSKHVSDFEKMMDEAFKR